MGIVGKGAVGWAVCASLMGVPAYLQPKLGVQSMLMFDGVCNLCDGFINFVRAGFCSRLRLRP